MITTGQNLERIIEMLNLFKSEVQICSQLGLLNINKHSENFIKRLLNLIYNLELENLNKGKSNFPGLDLGDSDQGIAYQISSTKSSEKINHTLDVCLKNEHFKIYPTINILILTGKLNSYSIKFETAPFFAFSPLKNILDISDLLRDIESLASNRIKAIHDYLKTELQSTISQIKTDSPLKQPNLLDIEEGLGLAKLPHYAHWSAKITLLSENISVPEIHAKLSEFLQNQELRFFFLKIFDSTKIANKSTRQILYLDKLEKTNFTNYFYGSALQIESSSIRWEKIDYTNENVLWNMLPEMLALLGCILFFAEQTDDNFKLNISISGKSNTKVYFNPLNSLVLDRLLNTYILEQEFEIEETIHDSDDSTLAELFRKIIYSFVSEPGSFNAHPFLLINKEHAEKNIASLKNRLGIDDSLDLYALI